MAIIILGNVDNAIDNKDGVINIYNNTPAQQTQRNVVDIDADAITNHNNNNDYQEIFLPTDHNTTATEALLVNCIENSSKKSEVVRQLYKNNMHFNLHEKTCSRKAELINAFMLNKHINKFKTPFSDDDFQRNYN